MTISSSLNAGIAGLSANAARLASISDNIANASTYGYKRVQTDFSALVATGTGGKYIAGGVSAQSYRNMDTRGSLVTTTNATDLSVRGNGFLPVARYSEIAAGTKPQMLLATTGSFHADQNGYLKTATGEVLMGWPANPDGTIPTYPRDSADSLQPVRVSSGQLDGQPTTKIDMGVNLPATSTEAGQPGDPEALSIEYFNSLGKSERLDVKFTPTVPATGSSNEWTVSITDTASNNAVVGEYVLTFDNNGTLNTVTNSAGDPYNPATGLASVTTAGGPIELNFGLLGAKDMMSQLSHRFSPVAVGKDGAPVGKMTSLKVDETGLVHAHFDTGVTRPIYRIPVVDMPNANGLTASDNQTFKITNESGPFYLWDAGSGPSGEIIGFSREESTTDVAGELTDMIKTQRAYSSNAKVIQTVDEMLQETTNIKR